jgi:hypothetical protein
MNINKSTLFVTISTLVIILSFGLSTVAEETKNAGTSSYTSKIDANQIIGTWVATVTMRNCQTNEALRSFPVLNSFHQGGTMMETSRSLANRSPGLGIWDRIAGNTYVSVFIFFRSNPDGTDNGYQKIKRRHTVEGNTLTTVATFENYSPQGVVTSNGCATETATRLIP